MPEHEPQEEKELNFRDLFIPLTNTKVIWFIIIIGLIVFGNGLFNSFVGDDMLQIIENPVIHSITHLPTFFSGGTFYNGGGQKLGGAFYRPITATLYSMTYTLFGSSAFAFHFVLMLLFIINACFLFLVFKQFFEKHLAFVLSLIFLVHPINSETALYVSDTQDVLFFFFGIVALWILQHYQSKKTFVAASFLLLFSLLSKETGILFLFITVAYIFICKRKYFSRWLASILPLIGVYVVLRISVIGLITKTIANAPIQKLDLLTRLINIPEVFLFYLKTFIFPVELSSSYQWVYTQIDFNHFFLPLLIDLLFLGGIVGSAVFLHKNYARKYFLHYVFFVMWFLCGILLHLQIIPLDKTVAVRWFYFPIVGILGMIGVLFEAFRVTTKNIWVLSIAFILIGLLATRTFIRTFDYRNELTLVRHDIPVSPVAYDLE
ncbi:MAG: glycosyltransferase family 39 protein, partial [Candidatus Levyibacteriota bacterium]